MSIVSFYNMFLLKTGYIPVFIKNLEHIAIFEGKRHNIFDNIFFYRFFINLKENKVTVLFLNEDNNILYRGNNILGVSFQEAIDYYIESESSISHYD
jgi:hypothetical protein